MTEKASERTPEQVEKTVDQGGDRADRFTYSGPCDMHADETE